MSFEPPADWRRITTIDAHTAGEPLRVVCDGLPPIPGETMLEKRRYAREHLDSLRAIPNLTLWRPAEMGSSAAATSESRVSRMASIPGCWRARASMKAPER